MTFAHFKTLNNSSKELLCWEKGVLVATRKDQTHFFKLYQVFAFYIEVSYKLPFHTLGGFSAFETMEKLDPYLNQIDVDII